MPEKEDKNPLGLDNSAGLKGATFDSVQALRIRILGLSRNTKQYTMIAADVTGYGICVYASVWLLFGGQMAVSSLVWLLAAAVLVAVPITGLMGLYVSIIRYMGLDLFVAGTKAATFSAALLGVISSLTGLVSAPVRWAVAFGAISLIYVVGGRTVARVFLNRQNPNREQVIVYGAGEGGARLIAALFDGDDYFPVALIDDSTDLHGKRIHGLEIYSPSQLEELIKKTDATGVLLAVPSASRRKRRQILERLSEYSVRVQTIPEIKDLVSGKARVDDIRDVDIVDLLGRDAVSPDAKLLRASIDGKSVMVTGAGGSIGSELCRQIIHLGPKCLVLFEISEIALYNIGKELRFTATSSEIDCEIVSLLGSVHHKDRVLETLQTFNVCTVYHAAAYKHVPVVEHNLLEGVDNNVFGTLHVAEAAIDADVETFVLISTDKAVSPTSVMGATKRLAELTLQALQDDHPAVRFSMVRFGNVLASSGSVVPLFREQIRNGGPVTVTHHEIIRYFMTIPEAAQLVIQAGALAKGGDVFVLDMGQPVKIRDLARRMINLMGLTVRDESNLDGDIAIEYTGLRPGEKLYEELLIGNDVSGTDHPRIMRASEDYVPLPELKLLLDELKSAVLDLDRDRTHEILKHVVAGYEPANGIDDVIWVRAHVLVTDEDEGKVIDFTTRRA